MGRPTQIVSSMQRDQTHVADRLIQVVYQELRQLARRYLANDRAGQQMQPTSLIHEAYLRLRRSERDDWADAGAFFAAAAEAMRRVLIERARRQQRVRHGGGVQTLPLYEADVATGWPTEQLLALNEALERLEQHSPRRAHLVKLRCFAGLGNEEAAQLMDISRATADRYWRFARVWLYRAMEGEDAGEPADGP